MPVKIVLLTIASAGALALLVGLRAEVTRSREGKMLAFVALFLLPVGAALLGFSEHMERATSTQFCLSCHVMHDYGQSLLIDDPSYLPAQHYQNNRVPRDRACYTCHTDYTMFGTVTAKLRGLRHLQVQYFGNIPAPQDIKLYTPYNNRECLHCHLGSRKFEEASPHRKTDDLLMQMKSGKRSCTSSGCHEFIHDVGNLKDVKLWTGAQLP
jgi:cytochrome c-type protein NapC